MSNYIDINIINPTGLLQSVEIFNATNTFANTVNPLLANVNFPMIPLNTVDGYTPGTLGKTYWTKEGYLKTESTTGGVITILSPKYNYRALLNANLKTPIRVEKMRLAVLLNASLDQTWQIVRQDIFGNQSSDVLTPRDYYSTNNVQPNIVDIPYPLTIDENTGITIPLLPGEQDFLLTLFCSQ